MKLSMQELITLTNFFNMMNTTKRDNILKTIGWCLLFVLVVGNIYYWAGDMKKIHSTDRPARKVHIDSLKTNKNVR